jgi:hypothetical protein
MRSTLTKPSLLAACCALAIPGLAFAEGADGNEAATGESEQPTSLPVLSHAPEPPAPPEAVEAADEVAGGPSAAAAGAEARGGVPIALGVSGGMLRRNDYGDRTRSVFVPEIVGFVYAPTPIARVHLRPGLRLGYSRFGAAEMPGSLRFTERDRTASAELGLLYDGVIIPTLTGGAGFRLRKVDLALGRSINAEAEPISGLEALPTLYGQFALGLPLGQTPLVAEPFARLEHIVGDDRSRWRFGVDITVELPR